MKKIKAVCWLLLTSYTVTAQVRLPRLIRDSMILQRDANVNVWGGASANEKVSVRFKNKTYKTSADKTGKWKIKLPPTAAGGPYTMDIMASNKISLKEILF